MKLAIGPGKFIEIVEGDITAIEADAIVNAANSALAGGGGVDGAIHHAGGPSLMAELDGIRKRDGGCATGGAVATGPGLLKARYVFHAVGPIYRDGTRGEAALLRACYAACFRLAEERGLRRIAFPAISAGAYGYPFAEAARIGLAAAREHLERAAGSVREAIFVLFGQSAYRTYERLLR